MHFSGCIHVHLALINTIAEAHEGQSRTTVFLKSVEDLCRHSGNDWYRVYLIRKIGSQHGVEQVQKLLKLKQRSWLFPEEVLQMVQLLHCVFCVCLKEDNIILKMYILF